MFIYFQRPENGDFSGETMKRKLVVCDPKKCLGCFLCEFACSSKKERSMDPLLSRIRTVNLEPRGSMAITCLLCEDPTCIRSCPRNALNRSEETGVVVVDESKCVGCSWCLISCPFGAINPHPTKRIVTICDLCEGTPVCVDACPFEALKFTSVEEIADISRKNALEKLLENLGGA